MWVCNQIRGNFCSYEKWATAAHYILVYSYFYKLTFSHGDQSISRCLHRSFEYMIQTNCKLSFSMSIMNSRRYGEWAQAQGTEYPIHIDIALYLLLTCTIIFIFTIRKIIEPKFIYADVITLLRTLYDWFQIKIDMKLFILLFIVYCIYNCNCNNNGSVLVIKTKKSSYTTRRDFFFN